MFRGRLHNSAVVAIVCVTIAMCFCGYVSAQDVEPPYSYPIAVGSTFCSANCPGGSTYPTICGLYPPIALFVEPISAPDNLKFAWTSQLFQPGSSGAYSELMCAGMPFQDICASGGIWSVLGTSSVAMRDLESLMFDPTFDSANKEKDFGGNVIGWWAILPQTMNPTPMSPPYLNPVIGYARVHIIAICGGTGIGCRQYKAPYGLCYPSGPYQKFSIVIDQISCFSCGQSPNIFVNPMSLNFDWVPHNFPLTLSVSNNGDGFLVIRKLSIAGLDASDFTIQQDNCSGRFLMPWENCSLDVTFTPNTQGEKNADIVISSNDPDMPVINIPVTGSALPARTIHSIHQTDDNGYVLLESFADWSGKNAWITKFDVNGNGEWRKKYDNVSLASIQQTLDGGYIVAGKDYDIVVIKLSPYGRIEWQNAYHGNGYNSAASIRQTHDGGYIVVGKTISFGVEDYDAWVMKIDSIGNMQWSNAYHGNNDDSLKSIQQTQDGGYIAIGKTTSFGAGGYDVLILKLYADGFPQWQKTFGGINTDESYLIRQTSEGGFIVLGGTTSFGSGDYDAWLLKLDTNGYIQWQKSYGGENRDILMSINQTGDGGYIASGNFSDSSGAWILKLDNEGEIQWQKTYPGSNNSLVSIQQTTDGGYITAGLTNLVSIYGDPLILKLDGYGNLIDCPPIMDVPNGNAPITITNATVQENWMPWDFSYLAFSPGYTSVWDEVYFSGLICISAPDILISPTDIDFQNVILGHSSTETVTISNIGDADLNISGITLSDSYTYSYNVYGGPNPCLSATPTIAPQSSCTLTVTFNPYSEGQINATLTISSNDPDEPSLDILLSGTGVPLYTLSINIYGSGIVTGTDINCPSDCFESYSSGDYVEITAIPSSGWQFDSWDTYLCGNTNPCTILMNSDISITAYFKEVDTDGDGIPDSQDNCPTAQNPYQADMDGDGNGDVCDICPNDAANDMDSDGICGDVDNCPTTSNPGQIDSDGDGMGNACDACPLDSLNDTDTDGVCGNVDNCPQIANPTELIFSQDFEDSSGFTIGGGIATGYWGMAPLNGSASIPSYFVQGGGQSGNIFYGSFAKDFSNLDASPTMTISLPFLTNFTNLTLTVALAAPYNPSGTMWEISHRDKLEISSDTGTIDLFRPISGASPLRSQTYLTDLGYTFQDYEYVISDSLDSLTFTFASTGYDETIGIDSVRIKLQLDSDGDGLGDACDLCPFDADNDADEDGVCGNIDNCPTISNASQLDSDGDGKGDICDNCPYDKDDDIDMDGVCGDIDNCPSISNPTQTDVDTDGKGDACDTCPLDANNDADGDGVCGNVDNCPNISNTNQLDSDADGIGDACDTCPYDKDNDADGDGICGDADNCPQIANSNQLDSDGDGKGDVCETCPLDAFNDVDGDGVCGNVDNCPNTTNANQLDFDGDGKGDACDQCPLDPLNDSDGDGICGNLDNCPYVSNASQSDSDGDGMGDTCDICPFDAQNDADADGVCGDIDNCRQVANTDQSDSDSDGIGNACDSCPFDTNNDIDGDSICGDVDNCPFVANPNQTDMDKDGIGDACDNDADGDGFVKGVDCNDLNPLINPFACDIRNDGIDQDCDGKDRTKGQPCVGEADGDLKELACNDRIDNDKDGLIDCVDPDCARKKECR